MTDEKLTKHTEKWLLDWFNGNESEREVRLKRIGWDSVSFPRYRAAAFDGDALVATGEAADAWSAIDVLAVQLAGRRGDG